MYVCIYVCMYIRMYVCMHVHMCIACMCVQMRRKGYEQRYWRASRVDIVARDFMRGYIDRLSSCFFERDSLIICLDIGAGEDFWFFVVGARASQSVYANICEQNKQVPVCQT